MLTVCQCQLPKRYFLISCFLIGVGWADLPEIRMPGSVQWRCHQKRCKVEYSKFIRGNLLHILNVTYLGLLLACATFFALAILASVVSTLRIYLIDCSLENIELINFVFLLHYRNKMVPLWLFPLSLMLFLCVTSIFSLKRLALLSSSKKHYFLKRLRFVICNLFPMSFNLRH